MSNTNAQTVEERLHRLKALMEALVCVAERSEFVVDVANVSGFLGIMAREELTAVKTVLGADVMGRKC